MRDMLKVFIGYDSREPVGYHVAAHSILARASRPIAVIPLRQDTLRAAGLYWRPTDKKAATEFSLTRFLVPALSGFDGWSIFMDSDMLVREDLNGLVDMCRAHPEYAVSVCQHDYVPKHAIKMDGKVQEAYPRKNWSSFMVFHNAQCRALTPEYVNKASGLELHRFQWLEDRQIGALPVQWNWLVGEYGRLPDGRWSWPHADLQCFSPEEPKILHYTNGLPCFLDYERCDHADLWLEEYGRMTAPMRAGPFAREAWMTKGVV